MTASGFKITSRAATCNCTSRGQGAAGLIGSFPLSLPFCRNHSAIDSRDGARLTLGNFDDAVKRVPLRPECPFCDSPNVERIGRVFFCQTCGKDWAAE